MKVEIELNIDSMGRPCIKFRHHDKDGSLEQKMLKKFIEYAASDGLILVHKTGYLRMGSPDSWEDYEIQTAVKI